VPDATENESATFPDPAGGAYHPLLVKRSPAALAACALLLFGACREAGVGGGEASSDGLVFVRRGEGSDSDIWQARLSDGAERQLLRTPGRAETWPYWSGALHRLVVQLPPRGRSGPQLVLLDPETGRETPVPGVSEVVQNWPEWSPDGRRLAYAFRTRSGAGVAVVDAESGHREASWHGRLVRPAFAPDGQRLVAQRIDGDRSVLFLLEPGREPRALAEEGSFDDKGRFTRDGAAIVFQRGAKRDAPRDLLRVRPGNSGAELLGSGPDADDFAAAPSPTRDEIAFVSDRDGSPDLFLLGPDGGSRNLSRSPGEGEMAPQWSPNGERIALTVETEGGGELRVRVVDREGRRLYEAPGMMPSWMAPWR
jgi:Tol biopolymer transport system component